MQEFFIEANVKNLALTLLENFNPADETALTNLCKNVLFPFDEFKLKRKAVSTSESISFHTSVIRKIKIGFRIENYLERNDGSLKLASACDFKTEEDFHIFGELGEDAKSIETELPKDFALITSLVPILLCQIIARQDLIERQTVDYSKLNKKRAKSGKASLPTMTRVVLRRSAQELTRNTIQMHAVNVEKKETCRRRLHDVRSHIRLKNGKIEIVRAHKRGDASLGLVKQLRIVR